MHRECIPPKSLNAFVRFDKKTENWTQMKRIRNGRKKMAWTHMKTIKNRYNSCAMKL